MGPLAWKVLGTGSAILAGVLATKLVNAVWGKAVKDEINPKDPDAPLAKAVAYAAITGLAVGVARTFTERKAAAYYAKSAGHLPKEIAEEPVS